MRFRPDSFLGWLNHATDRTNSNYLTWFPNSRRTHAEGHGFVCVTGDLVVEIWVTAPTATVAGRRTDTGIYHLRLTPRVPPEIERFAGVTWKIQLDVEDRESTV